MRLLIALAALIALASPAPAQQTIADQARTAFGLFAAGLSTNAFLSGTAGVKLFSGIAGRWARLDGPDSKSGAETYGVDQQKICDGQSALTVTAPTPLTLIVSTSRPSNNLVFDYQLIAGTTFAEHVDVPSYLKSIGLGLDKPNVTATQRALALTYVNGLVQIYRPSEDILVMTRDRGYPVIMARCPPV